MHLPKFDTNFEPAVAYSIAILLGLVTTYIDFQAYFAQARIAVTSPFRLKNPGYCHWPTVAFFIFASALNCIFLYLLQKRAIFSNELIVNALIAGSGATMLLKSKLFSIQKGEASFGFLWIYEWIKTQALERLNNYLGGIRVSLSRTLAGEHGAKLNIVQRLSEKTRDIAIMVKIDPEVAADFQRQFLDVSARSYTDQRDRLAALLLVMMAYTSFDFVENLLKQM